VYVDDRIADSVMAVNPSLRSVAEFTAYAKAFTETNSKSPRRV